MTTTQTNAKADWTIMVYVAANELLLSFAVESLKQLKRAAGNGVVVAAQFDSDGKREIRRFIFDGTTEPDGSLENDVKEPLLSPPVVMAAPKTLADFIAWVHKQPQCAARHYGLLAWGDGSELLLDEGPLVKGANGQSVATRTFLTPVDLKTALSAAFAKSGEKFDIIGFDACFMSNLEVACELKGYANFMLASQDEVPDASFPYDRVLDILRTLKDDVPGICRAIAQGYKAVYRDHCFYQPPSGMKSVTLSALQLNYREAVTTPIRKLANALLASASNEIASKAILSSRAKAKGLAAGIFVDIFDFCDHLHQELKVNTANDLREACDEVCSSIAPGGDGAFVLDNETTRHEGCYGVSIYFPYLKDDEMKALEAPLLQRGLGILTKGGTDILGKGGTDILGKGGTDILGKGRRERIEEIEGYYHHLTSMTDWCNFIAHGWSRILAREAEQKQGELDLRYSASQCALNLLSLCQELETNSKQSAHKTAASKKPASKKTASNKAAAA